VSPVQKVIQLLDELKGKVSADLANEAKQAEENKGWCEGRQNEKQDAITSSKRDVADLQATIEDSTATIGSLTSTIDELTNSISKSEAELQGATELRQKARSDFNAAEKELVDTVDSLERATSVLKKNLGLLQSGKISKVMGMMTAGLQKVVEASWVNSHQKQVLQSLLQAQAGDEDSQPQASVEAYSSQSSGIIDTIADMQGKAEESLSSARKDEMEAQHAYEMVKQGLEDEIAVGKKQLSEATLQRSEKQEELSSAQKGLTEAQQTLAADEEYLAELDQFSANKAASWAERQKQAKEEMAAIEMATETLSSGVKVLLQTSSRVVSKVALSSAGVRDQVAGVLKRLAKEFHSYGLMQASYSAKSDPFGKIRGLVEGMIDKLEKQAAEEADSKAFCDEERSKSKAKQGDLTGKLDKNAARIQKAEAGKATLAEEIHQLEAEIAEIDAGQAEATQMRQDEHAEYLQASKDYKESADAVAKAIQQLSDYYNSASGTKHVEFEGLQTSPSFLQLRTATRMSNPKFGGPSTDVGTTIISMLEIAESDFTRLLAESEAEESSAEDEYNKLTQENKIGKTTKQGAAKGKSQEAKQLEVALDNYKDDRQTTSGELDAVLGYLDKLKPQCETKVMSYGEKKARREKELAGLEEAMTILSGSA